MAKITFAIYKSHNFPRIIFKSSSIFSFVCEYIKMSSIKTVTNLMMKVLEILVSLKDITKKSQSPTIYPKCGFWYIASPHLELIILGSQIKFFLKCFVALFISQTDNQSWAIAIFNL